MGEQSPQRDGRCWQKRGWPNWLGPARLASRPIHQPLILSNGKGYRQFFVEGISGVMSAPYYGVAMPQLCVRSQQINSVDYFGPHQPAPA